MGVVINVATLARELARRGWMSTDLAREAGLSHATISAARSGRPVSPTTVRLIAAALGRTPPLDEIDVLLF